MCTGSRRFLLRLAVGLLAFLIGVTAAWALGGINPFQSFSGTRYYRQYNRYGYYPRAEGGTILLKEEHGCKMKRRISELPPPPPPPPRPAAELR